MIDSALQNLLGCDLFLEAFTLQVRTLDSFYDLARPIAGTRCPIASPPDQLKHIKRNFFSTLFLAVTRQMVGQSKYLPLYAMVNQAMRAWVTACDNILDDEYKEIFRFQLAGNGSRMKSVLTLLISDRVVSLYVSQRYKDTALLETVERISLQALIPSALQECEEEARPVPILEPDEILDDIHARKTGDLFAAPLALPIELENIPTARSEAATRSLELFGLGCQIIDDMKDMPDDVRTGRHNLLVSLIACNRGGDTHWLQRLRSEPADSWTAWDRFEQTVSDARDMAVDRFESSFDALTEIGLEFSAAQQTAMIGCMFGLLKVPFKPEAVLGGPSRI